MSFYKTYKCIDGENGAFKNTKILLAYPRTGADAEGFSLHVPLSLLYLCTQLKDFSIVLFDQRVDDMSVFERLLSEGPICVGISTMTGKQIEYALGLAEKVKEKGIPTVFGGVHPTLIPHQTIKDSRVDYVISGEGEIAFRNLVLMLLDGLKPAEITYGPEIDMNRLNLMEVYDLIDIERYIKNHVMEGRCLPFQFSRGCPFSCTYCCNSVLSKNKWRMQSTDTAKDILQRMVDKYKLDSVWFIDENLTVKPEVVNSLAAQINSKFKWFVQSRAKSLLKLDLEYLDRMGMRGIGSGLESGSNRILKEVKKVQETKDYIEANQKLAKTNITIWYNYMMGYPTETIEDLKETLELALRMLRDNPNAYNNTFYLLSPYPGTEIGELNYKEYYPEKFEDWAKFSRHNIEAKWHTPEMLKLYEKITFSSKFVGRKLIRTYPNNKSLSELTNILTKKWENFDFYNDDEWDRFKKMGYDILKELFGENAY